MKKSNTRPLIADLLLGAAAGAAATWAMDKVTTVLYDRQPKKAQEAEEDTRGGKTAYVIAAEKLTTAMGVELDEKNEEKLGSAIHWMLGIGAGTVYGALRNYLPRARFGSGLAYGALFWLTMDEAALTLLGLTPPPDKFPWQTHVRGAAGHLVFGTVTEAFFDVADVAA
jgi:hypothetical protein